MAKEQFLYAETKPVFDLIEVTSQRSGVSRAQAFEDFLHMGVCALSGGQLEEQYMATVARHTEGKQGQRGCDSIARAFGTLTDVMDKTRNDILGDLFQGGITYGEAGQFLTPEPICQMMAAMTVGDMNEDEGSHCKIVCDPCCGSGRMLLAVADLKPHWEFVGQDVDLRCVRMTALNLALRNMYGYVIWGNSLGLEKRLVYRTGFNLVGVIREIPVSHCPAPIQMIVAEPPPDAVPDGEGLTTTTRKAAATDLVDSRQRHPMSSSRCFVDHLRNPEGAQIHHRELHHHLQGHKRRLTSSSPKIKNLHPKYSDTIGARSPPWYISVSASTMQHIFQENQMSLSTATPLVTHADVASFAADKVNLSRDRAKTYRDQVNNLRDKLDRYIKDHPDLGLVKMLLSGSLAKGTALRTLNDIDVAVYVKAKDAPVDEGALLTWLAEKMRKAYPQMSPDQISPGNHAVRISYRGTGLDVDVVPVHYEGDADDRGYLYARDTGERILTSIPLHIKFIRTRKQRQPDHFAQVVRLVKWWVRQRKADNENFRLKSFLAEMLVSHVADAGVSLSDYPSALEAVFTYMVKSQLKDRVFFTDYYKKSELPERAAGQAMEVFDPVNSKNNVAKVYSATDRATLVTAAEEALDALAEARFTTTKGRAVECWQDVLGTSFRM